MPSHMISLSLEARGSRKWFAFARDKLRLSYIGELIPHFVDRALVS